MKKICYSILAAAMVATLASCSGNTDKGTATTDSTATKTTDTTVPTAAPVTPTPAPTAPVDSMSSSMKDTAKAAKMQSGNAAKPTPAAKAQKPEKEPLVGNTLKPKGN